jgi:hypothetical protein
MQPNLRQQLAQSTTPSVSGGPSTKDYYELLDYLDGLMDGLNTVMNSELETDKGFNGWH